MTPRSLIHALAKKNLRSSLPRSKEDRQEFIISGKAFQIDQPKPWPLSINTSHHPLTSPMRLEKLKTIQRIFSSFCRRMSMILPLGYVFDEHCGNGPVLMPLQDFLPCLKTHLLPCILEHIRSESENSSSSISVEQAELKHVILWHNWMYAHKIIKFNYTTYNMRWDQDVLNPGTSHCNFMTLAQPDSNEPSDEHPFLYSQILGIFHVNVIYNSPRMIDYNPRCFDFLWVCWYDLENSVPRKSKTTKLKASHCLNCLVFPSLDEENSVGFLDPVDVLQGCHIIPAFAQEKCFSDSEELSKCVHEDRDWNVYYIS